MIGNVIQGDANILSKKQDKIDNNLATNNKNIVDAINEVNSSLGNKANTSHTHTKTQISDFAHTHTKSEVSDFAHTHTKSQVSDFAHTHTKSEVSDFVHTHTKSQISDFPSLATVATSGSYTDLSNKPTIPTTLPASDVYAWAKMPNKPTYTAAEVGAATTGHSHPLVSSSSPGLMSTADKIKLDGIPEGGSGSGGDGSYVHPSSHPASMITGLSKVATTGNYNDLLNTPDPGSGPIISNTVTLLKTGWVNNSQVINLSSVKPNSLLWIAPVPSNLKAYSGAMIYASSQGIGTVTFACDTIPIIDLQVTIVNGGEV